MIFLFALLLIYFPSMTKRPRPQLVIKQSYTKHLQTVHKVTESKKASRQVSLFKLDSMDFCIVKRVKM